MMKVGAPANGRESGFILIEVMVALVLLAIVGLAAARNSLMSMTTLKRSIRNSIATELAVQKLEELGSINPTTLDASDNSSEPSIVVDDMEFSREATITVNSDNSRSVSVVVESTNSELGGSFTATSRFLLWGTT